MVDWDQVERLRAKGWDWSRIAEDDRAEFTADASGGDAGRQLRTLYYQRRSKAQRRSAENKGPDGGPGGPDPTKPSPLLRVGYFAVPFFGIWALLAFLFPSPVGVLVQFLILLLATVVAGFLLAFALLRSLVKWERALRVPLVLGVVLGLAAAGTVTLIAISEGCPNLTTTGGVSFQGSANGWTKYPSNAMWAENGAPIFFFYGSVACPYCSASSWAMTFALQQFGTLSGQTYSHSAIGDTPSNIPEIDLSGATLQSRYIALHVSEATDDSHVTTPALTSCQYQAYVSTYSGGSIPFVVIGGKYVHAGSSLVDPRALQTNGVSMTDAQVQAQMNNESGPAWNAISPAAFAMMAIMLKADGGQPSTVESSWPQVAQLMGGIS